MKPIKLKVLIKPDGKKTQTDSGIYTGPYSVEVGLRRGTVHSVGSMVKEVKEGDRVCWLSQDENFVEHNNERLVLLYVTQIIGHLENEDV